MSSIWLDVVSYLHIDLVLRWFHHRQLRPSTFMVNTATAAAARLLQLRHSELGGFTHYVATRRVPPPPPPATRGNCPHRGGVPRGSEPFLTRKNLCTKLHKTILISLSLLIKGGTRTNLLFSRTVLHQAGAGHYRQYPIRLFTTNSTQQLASPRISPQSALLSDILIINTATHSRAPRNCSVPSTTSTCHFQSPPARQFRLQRSRR